MSAIVRSIAEKLLVLPDDIMVYPGHGDATTIGHEKQYNPVAAYEKARRTGMIGILLNDSAYEQDIRELLMAFYPGQTFVHEMQDDLDFLWRER